METAPGERPAAVYGERRARFAAEAERLGARSLAFSIARFATPRRPR